MNAADRSIVLCGFMGCGKTVIGKLLAEVLGRDFYDTDEETVRMYGMSIPDMFGIYGEEYFRRAEHTAAAAAADRVTRGHDRGAVISTGGGFVTYRDNRILFPGESFLTVWIYRDPELCLELAARDKGRPLGAGRSREELLALYEARKPLYEEFAMYSVKNDGTPEECAGKITGLLRDVIRT